MHEFEKFLMAIGYKKYRLARPYDKTKEVHVEEKEGRHFFSTMDNLDYVYVKNGNWRIGWCFVFGLNESGKPPTLKSRLPNYKNTTGESLTHDDIANRLLAKYHPSDIYIAIFDRTITLEL